MGEYPTRFLICNEAHRLINFDNSIKDHAAAFVSDKDFAKREERWQVDTPDTKEAYYIREIFDGERYLEINRLEVTCPPGSLGLFPSEAAAKTAVR
jgi:asparagine synthase (glutamine-hydrolysing)